MDNNTREAVRSDDAVAEEIERTVPNANIEPEKVAPKAKQVKGKFLNAFGMVVACGAYFKLTHRAVMGLPTSLIDGSTQWSARPNWSDKTVTVTRKQDWATDNPIIHEKIFQPEDFLEFDK